MLLRGCYGLELILPSASGKATDAQWGGDSAEKLHHQQFWYGLVTPRRRAGRT